MKAYYLFGRILKIPLAVGFYFYSLLTRTPRVRLVVMNENKELLLVKSWTSSGEWSFPGGGVERGEPHEAAACRELREETGMDAAEKHLTPLTVIHTHGHDEIVFFLRVSDQRLPDVLPSRYEIQDAAWFPSDSLPRLGPLAQQILTKMDTNQ